MPESKKARRAGYVILAVIIVGTLTVIWVNRYLSQRVLAEMKERISAGSNGLYVMTADNLSVNILSRNLSIEGFVIAPKNKNDQSARVHYALQAKQLNISGFSILPFIRNKDLFISEISFDKPQISVFRGRDHTVNKKDTAARLSLYRIISPKLSSLSVGRITIENCRLNIFRDGADTAALLSVSDNDIIIKKFSVNQTCDRVDRLFLAESCELSAKNVSFHLPDKLYTIFAKRIKASYTDSLIKIDSFQLVPNYSKKEFGKAAKKQITRVELIATEITLNRIDVKLFIEENWLACHLLTVDGCRINAYRDNNIPLAPIVRPTVQSMIHDVPFFISIDSVVLKNGTAEYEDLAEKTAQPGKMTLEGLNACITGLQNDTASYTGKSCIKAVLRTVFQGQGIFNISYEFPLKTREEICHCSGSLSPMNIAALNPLLIPSKKIAVRSGVVDSAYFSFITNSTASRGKMMLAYHDLRVEMLEDKKNETGLKRELKNLLANKLVLKEDNPGKDKRVRIVDMGVEKNKYRFFPYFFMQSMLSGITASIEGEVKSKVLKRTKLLEKK